VINARVAMRSRKLYHQRIIVITQRGVSRKQQRAMPPLLLPLPLRGRRKGGGAIENLAIRAMRCVIIPRVVNA